MIKDLDFISPEAAGIPSGKIIDFIDEIEEARINLHSFLMARGGKIFAEGYYKPIDENFRHRIYSISKSFVSLAIGRLVGEGRISVTDKIVDYFPEYYDKNSSNEWISSLTIEEMLKMTTPMSSPNYSRGVNAPISEAPNNLLREGWTKCFFEYTDKHDRPNGMLFRYDSNASHVLGVLVEKLTGMTFLEYLRPVFDKIGVSEEIKCVRCPDGHSWGASGVICTLRDLAKVGELLLNLGESNGEQLLPREYMMKATSRLVDINYDNGDKIYSNGYGYQIWTHKYGFEMIGMYSQRVICFPDRDFLFVCNGNTANKKDSSAHYELLHSAVLRIYKALGEALPENEAENAKLREKLSNLTMLGGFGEKDSPIVSSVSGVTYDLAPNPMEIKWIRLELSKEENRLVYENPRGVKEIPFGMEEFKEFSFPETHYYGMQVGTPKGEGQRAVASAAWTMENRLLIRVNIIDTSIGHLGIVLEFKDEDTVAVQFTKSAEAFLGEYNGTSYGYRR
jgi:CubicO group peptidase (beta-lactamase class C family)